MASRSRRTAAWLRPAAAAWMGAAACLAGAAPRLAAQDFMVRLDLRGEQLEGGPLVWDKSRVLLLGRDGRLHDIDPAECRNFARAANRFVGYSSGDLRAQLQNEFDDDYEVSGAGRFVVAHPRGQRGAWADRFDELYRSFWRYFAVRGFDLQEPPYALAAVVFPTREEFVAKALAEGSRVAPGVVGYYSLATNRIYLYDQSQGRADARGARDTADTIIHEATHQTAFNTGVHDRFTRPPLWVVEGLGVMFEAPGVWNAHSHPHLPQRVNAYRLRAFRRAGVDDQGAWIGELLASDEVFRRDPEAAYARAWALTFYLVEKEPRNYFAYLRQTTGKPPFSAVTADERLADFAAVFGGNPRMLNARVTRFIAELE